MKTINTKHNITIFYTTYLKKATYSEKNSKILNLIHTILAYCEICIHILESCKDEHIFSILHAAIILNFLSIHKDKQKNCANHSTGVLSFN